MQEEMSFFNFKNIGVHHLSPLRHYHAHYYGSQCGFAEEGASELFHDDAE